MTFSFPAAVSLSQAVDRWSPTRPSRAPHTEENSAMLSHCSYVVRACILSGTMILGACDSGPVEAERRAENLLRFDFAGLRSGSYHARGVAPPDQSLTGSFAGGDTQGLRVIMSSFSTTVAPRGDRVTIETPWNKGTFPFVCPEDAPDQCAWLVVIFDHDPTSGRAGNGQAFARLDSGSLNITEITSTRVRGTFSGAGTLYTSGGGVGPIDVSGGVFDVELQGDF